MAGTCAVSVSNISSVAGMIGAPSVHSAIATTDVTLPIDNLVASVKNRYVTATSIRSSSAVPVRSPVETTADVRCCYVRNCVTVSTDDDVDTNNGYDVVVGS